MKVSSLLRRKPLADRDYGVRRPLAFPILTLWLAAGAPALAEAPQQCTAQWNDMNKARQTGPLSYKVFMAGCLAGRAPQSLPTIDAPEGAPAHATARCRDGSYTTTTVSLGACEHHRGVVAVLR